MGSALLPSNDHSEIGDLAFSNLTECSFEFIKRAFFIARGQCSRQLDLPSVPHATYPRRRDHSSIYDPRLLWIRTNGAYIVVIGLRILNKVKNIFMNITQFVERIVWPAFDFVPDHIISEHPTLFIGELKCHPPGNPQKLFVLIGIAEVKPKGSCVFEHPPYFVKHNSEVINVLAVVGL